ncbi:SPOR domain-containing protein [Thiococcus pfennigii]|uniref:SPOR domain-containing protein n=1 Tax=Thiococcus pfennigii TaxID=1057 RepID=UPI001903FCDB|nr:hypothetical protein [Thiococcus pfennigii]MBK1733023.1 hypothetical protein [Thiococcus pfennigii]
MQQHKGTATGDAEPGARPAPDDQFDPTAMPIWASPSAEPDDGPADTATRGLAAGVAALHARLDEIERSLIERIADVDDDRRRTAVLLQRARQGQDEEVAARLHRQASATRWAMLGLAAFVILALAFVYWDRPPAGAPLQAEREGVQAEDLAAIEARLAALSTTVADLGDQPRPAAAAEVADLSAALARLEEDQRRLAGEVAALRERLAERTTATKSAPAGNAADTTPATAAPSPANEPPSERASERTTPPAAPSEPRSGPDEAEPATSGQPGAEVPSATGDTGHDLVRIADRPYALQLVGYFDRDQLFAFAARDDLPASVFYREETHQDRPWFVVIHSLYPSYGDAVAARADLPAELLALDPLVRRLPAGTEIMRLGP